jgi:hypothetical protein
MAISAESSVHTGPKIQPSGAQAGFAKAGYHARGSIHALASGARNVRQKKPIKAAMLRP